MIVFDFNTFTIDLLPQELRKDKMIEFLTILSSEIQLMNDNLLSKHNKDVSEIKHNSQIILFEDILNRDIDVFGVPIRIDDTDKLPVHYIACPPVTPVVILEEYTEGPIVVLYNPTNFFLGNDGEVVPSGYKIWLARDEDYSSEESVDFIVKVDSIDYSNSQKLNAIKGIIEKYKLAGTTYKVKVY